MLILLNYSCNFRRKLTVSQPRNHTGGTLDRPSFQSRVYAQLNDAVKAKFNVRINSSIWSVEAEKNPITYRIVISFYSWFSSSIILNLRWTSVQMTPSRSTWLVLKSPRWIGTESDPTCGSYTCWHNFTQSRSRASASFLNCCSLPGTIFFAVMQGQAFCAR